MSPKPMKSVVIVGAGALGSHVAMLLRNAEAQIKVIDFDRVEQRNVQSQFHSKPHVGKLKVASLQQAMNFLFGTKIDVIPHKLTTENAEQLLGAADLIIDCLDNGAGRRVIQAFVRSAPMAIQFQVTVGSKVGTGSSIMRPCLHGALDAHGSYGRVVWDEKFVIDDEPSEGAATCEDGRHLPFIAMTASYIAYAAQLFLVQSRKVGFEVTPIGAICT